MGVSNFATMDHEQVVFCHHKQSGLRAIIAIHDTTLGPSLGGCRYWNYESYNDALFDVLRLSKGMTYKAAIAGLNLGGGKAVIMGDIKNKTPSLMHAFGMFVNSLSGRYITAADVNIRVEDVTAISEETNYVAGKDPKRGGSGDPSPVTALGVFHGIRASVKHKLNKDDLAGLTVAVQGLGAVGGSLCGLLHEASVNLVISDIDAERSTELAKLYGAKVVSPTTIHKEVVDVYSPCALGAILNQDSILELNTPIVAGGANNQLLDEEEDGRRLIEREILYAPDYVVNAGGLINVAHELKGYNADAAKKEAENIYHTLLKIFDQADKYDIPTFQASAQVAEERITKKRGELGIASLKNTMDNQSWITI